MKVKALLICLPFLLLPSVQAQTLDDQLSAIADIRAEARAEKAAQERKLAKKRATEEAARQKALQARLAEKQRLAKEKAEKAEKRENDLYELEMQERRMALEMKRSKLDREKALNQAYSNKADAFVEEELAAKQALRDRLQADSDATRSISEGIKNNLTEEHKGFFK